MVRTTRSKLFLVSILFGWLGIGLVIAWASLEFGEELFLGSDSYWILPVAITIIVLFAIYGSIYVTREYKPRFLRKKERKPVKWKTIPLISLSLVAMVSGSYLFFGMAIDYYSRQYNYNQVRELITSDDFLSDANRVARRDSIRGVMADYDLEPRLNGDPNTVAGPGHDNLTDIPALIANCEQMGVNCYHFLIWHRNTDWLDFQDFVVEAEASVDLMDKNFTIWVYLVPPSESHEKESEPFGQDYIAWMRAVANFSKDHPMVTAVCIDDFFCSGENKALFTESYLNQMRAAADEHDPTLALVSCLYWSSVDPSNLINVWEQAIAIAPHVDGILYPYMSQSAGPRNHEDTTALEHEISQVRQIYPLIPVVLDIYASKHSACDELPDAQYVGALLDGARQFCDGVSLYCGPKKNPDGTMASWCTGMEGPEFIFNATRDRFSIWVSEGWI